MKPRIWLHAVPIVLLFLAPTVASAAVVTATFADGKGNYSNASGAVNNLVTSVADAFPGIPGGGWTNGWKYPLSSSGVTVTDKVLGPDDLGDYNQLVDGNYLSSKAAITNTSSARHAGVWRNYAGGINPTLAHSIQFTVRIEEDLAGANFSTSNDRYEIHDRADFAYYSSSGTLISPAVVYSSSYSTWGISCIGDYTINTFDEVDDHWLIRSADATIDTGIIATQNTPYTFTINFDPAAGANGTFGVTITSGTSTLFNGAAAGYNLGTCPSDDEHGPYTRQTTGNLLFSQLGMKDSGDSTNNRLWSIDAIGVTGTAPPGPGGLTQVAAHFNGGNSTTHTDGFKGTAGDGWNGAWQTYDWRVIPANTVVSPGDAEFNEIKPGVSGAYLKMTNTGENPDPEIEGGHGKSGVGRDYSRNNPDPGIDWTDAHTIKFTVRIDEDVAGAGTFNTSLDRYQIYDSSTPDSNMDATTVWAVQACGASDGGAITTDMVGEWIFTYGNGSGGTGGYADSNIDIVFGGVYDFTIVVDPTTQTYDATIQYGATTYTANDLVWKTASDTVGGSVTFMSVITTKDEVRAWSIDELVITEGAPAGIPGDTNGDGFVNAADARVLAQNWGRTDADGLEQIGDFNGDRAVNAADASILAANWTGNSEGTAVPEPGTLLLLAVGSLVLAVRRRHVGR